MKDARDIASCAPRLLDLRVSDAHRLSVEHLQTRALHIALLVLVLPEKNVQALVDD